MTDNELDELEALDPKERARLLSRKEQFVISNKTADIIVNDLFRDDDAKLGKVFRDLVAFNVDGTTDLIDNVDDQDTSDRTARHLLYNDCKAFIDRWLLTSRHNASNRKGKTKNKDDQTAKNEITEQPQASDKDDQDRPTLDDIKHYSVMILGGEPQEVREQLSERWYSNMTKSHWQDDRGEPIRNWHKVFKAYCDRSWCARSLEKQNKG